MDCRKVTILGSTGSIGENTLDVIARHPERFKVFALAARRDTARLAVQCADFGAEHAVVRDSERLDELRTALRDRKAGTRAHAGAQALADIVSGDCDTVVAGIAGTAGLAPTIAAARAGKRILLANKEALVVAGEHFIKTAHKNKSEILPIDSEHNAIFQCLSRSGTSSPDAVEQMTLTASGGPFLDLPVEHFASVTPEQACAHPNWKMGRKISVDSATMMNKGLELIEARWLFDIEAHRINVLVHPQSIVHALVGLKDGSVLAQMACPDMRIPIANALAWPERIASGARPLHLHEYGKLEFREVDAQRFPCLPLGRAALDLGVAAPAVLNAANEEAVAAFLDGRLAFDRIARINDATLEALGTVTAVNLEDVMEADRCARSYARRLMESSVDTLFAEQAVS